MSKYIYIFAYFGSKMRLIKRITLMLPKDCETGIEVCGGGGSFSLNRYRFFRNCIYNEYNEKIFNLFKMLKDRNSRKHIIERLISIPYNREVFNAAKYNYDNDYKEVEDKLEQAVMTYTVITQSYNNEKKFWSSKGKIGKPSKIRRRLEKVGLALEDISIQQEDCFKIIEEHGDEAKTFIFADVPYPHGTRTSKESYDKEFEWSDSMHEKFAKLVKDKKARVMICTYDSSIYNEILLEQANWHKIKIAELPSPSVNKEGKKNKKLEYIYINYDNYSDLAKLFILL